MPDYFQALREQDLEEMVEEERVFLDDFNIQNMTERNLQSADRVLQDIALQNKNKRWTIIGEPYYQIYKNFDYWVRFNSQHSHEEKSMKLLLNLPLVPPQYHSMVKLISYKLRMKVGQKAEA